MAPFIFTARNGIHILDLQQTIVNINSYYDMMRDMVAGGKTVLFVGTKRQAQEVIIEQADRCGMPHVSHRWLGGTLTNWKTIHDRIDTLKKLEKRRDAGEFELLTKKEGLVLTRKIEKLNIRLGGLREMKRLPDLLVIVDTEREATAVKEANTLGIPVLALADSNSNPDKVDFIIPANDDAVRAIKLLITAFADAIIEGRLMRKGDDSGANAMPDANSGAYDDFDKDQEEDDAAYLGASTMAKLRDASLFTEEEQG
jgi:small subunit ribosomal protein S2